MKESPPINRKKAFRGQFFDRIDSDTAFQYSHQFPRLPKFRSKLISSIFKFDGLVPGQLQQNSGVITPIINKIEVVDDDTIAIKRYLFYNSIFLNKRPYLQEVILVKRNTKNQENLVYESFSDFGWKKQHKELFHSGFYIRRCELNLSARVLQLLSSCFAIRCIGQIRKIQEKAFPAEMERKQRDRKELSCFEEATLTDLINLI